MKPMKFLFFSAWLTIGLTAPALASIGETITHKKNPIAGFQICDNGPFDPPPDPPSDHTDGGDPRHQDGDEHSHDLPGPQDCSYSMSCENGPSKPKKYKPYRD